MNARINKNIKYFSYFLEFILLYLLQNMPWIFPEILSVTPTLIIPAAITIAMLETETEAVFLGMIAGLMVDISFGMYIGLFGAIMAIICPFLSYFVKRVNINIYSASLYGFIAVIVCAMLDWLFRYVVPGYGNIWIFLINNYLPIYLYSTLVLPLLYILNLGVHNGLKSVELADEIE